MRAFTETCELRVVPTELGAISPCRCRGMWFRAAAAMVTLAVVSVLGPLAVAAEAGQSDEAGLEFFERQVRPILVERCYECHGPEAADAKGGLRLDSREALLVGGDTGPAIVPGDPRASLLIDAIQYGDLYQMPPDTKLPASEIAILRRWVASGAAWPHGEAAAVAEVASFDLQARKASHWCWQVPEADELPAVHRAEWPRQAWDRFILAKLESEGLRPAATADRGTLVRRAYFDLIGLPPTPAQVKAFVDNDSSAAFEELVDQLLASPHYGERWARHWLDLVRYAETFGHEFDYPIQHAFRYRDYVIRALNADVPYDQLVREHLAGDLLDPPRRHPSELFNESVIGTGFWWLGEATHAPVDVREDEAGRIDNQIDVMTKTFLGLTVACARCHDHKFDAISTKDYYALAGFLRSSRRQEAFLDPGAKISQAVRKIRGLQRQGTRQIMDFFCANSGSSGDWFAERLFATWTNGRQDSDVGGASRGSESEVASRWTAATADPTLQQPDHPLHAWWLCRQRGEMDGPSARAVRDQLDKAARLAEAANAELPRFADFTSGEPSWFVAGHAFEPRPGAGGTQWNSRHVGIQLCLPGVADSGKVADGLQGVMHSPSFTLQHPHIYYRIAGDRAAVRLVVDGYFMDGFNSLLFAGFSADVDTKGQFVWQRQAQDVKHYLGHRAHLEIIDHGDGSVALDEIRFSHGDPPHTVPSSMSRQVLDRRPVTSARDLAAAYGECWEAAVQAIRGQTADAEQTRLVNWALRHGLVEEQKRLDRSLEPLRVELRRASNQLARPVRLLAMTDATAANERIFIRGNHRTLGAEAPRQLLTALVGSQPPVERGSGRLRLARQVADPANPLTARVIVNRIWHHLFGRGIVASVDNFGVLGQQPTHPELLDYLAVQFVEQGWSLKTMIRSLMLSSSYRMASTIDPTAERLDPENRWLHRMPVRRLQGEAIRDSILSLSGRLDRTMFGPSVPVHVTPFMQGRGRPKESGPRDGGGRRSVYTEVRRNFLSPTMLAFDTPIPFSTVGRRNTSNVPAQALILMNDPFIVDQAAVWATALLRRHTTPSAIIDEMYRAAFARPPTTRERQQSLDFVRTQSAERGLPPETAMGDVHSWADLAHVLWNVKEFVFLQ